MEDKKVARVILEDGYYKDFYTFEVALRTVFDLKENGTKCFLEILNPIYENEPCIFKF